MELLVFLFFLFFVISALRNAVKSAGQGGAGKSPGQGKAVLPPDFFGTHDLPPEQVHRVEGAPAGFLAARGSLEESSSELLWDEAAASHDLDLAAAEVVSLEPTVPAMSLAARPVPERGVSLETEVDWDAEHVRFHERYVDARPPAAAAARGLLDELRDPAGARRAVLMAEILGPPVSMRR